MLSNKIKIYKHGKWEEKTSAFEPRQMQTLKMQLGVQENLSDKCTRKIVHKGGEVRQVRFN